MALSPTTASSWLQSTDFPSKLFEWGRMEYELYEEDDAFVLSVEMPGFDSDEITVSWDDGTLDVAAEREDAEDGYRRTYHRRFQFPKAVDEDEIAAEYTNGVLEVRLPVAADAAEQGTEIEIAA
jgi:HSP20 family protein